MIFRQKADGEWEWGNDLGTGIVLNFGFNFVDEAEFVGIPPSVAAKAFAAEAREYADQLERQFTPPTPGVSAEEIRQAAKSAAAAEGKAKPKKKKAAKE